MIEDAPPMPYLERLERLISQQLTGQWSGIARDAVIATPAARRTIGALPAGLPSTPGPVSCNMWLLRSVVAAVDWSGINQLVYNPHSGFFAGRFKEGRAESVCVYDVSSGKVFTNSATSATWSAGVLFLAQLMLTQEPDIMAAYAALLDAQQPGTGSMTRDARAQLALTAQDELAYGIAADIAAETLGFYIGATESELRNLDSAECLDLKPLLTEPATLKSFIAGEQTIYTPVAAHKKPAQRAAVGPDSFIGGQLDKAKRYMAEGKHILHHGPTGTGKTYVWRKAMAELGMLPDGCESIDNYPYRIHGSGGLEDWQFIGTYAMLPDGSRSWTNGPLTQAMIDGRRLAVEELNRMPVAMQNILIGAMDYGVITLTQYDSKVIKACAGFAVDAMANIGAEFIGTEGIDPAIMRRFERKVAYDYLPEDDEVALLRSRNPELGATDARVLVRIANTIREQVEQGPTEVDCENAVSPAALLESAALVAQGYSIREAIEDTWLAEVATTKAQRASVMDKVDIHVAEGPKPRKKRS